MKAGDKCPCCGCTMNDAEAKQASESEAPEVEVSIEGDAKSIKEILSELIPEKSK